MSGSLRHGWSYKKLNELGFVGRGKSRHRPRNEPSLYGGPYPFIQTSDIMASEFYITNYSQTYSEKGLAQSKFWNENTLCMTIAGENTAETAILKFKACFPDSVIGFVADKNKADVRFVKYLLDTMKSQFKSVSKGATQDNLSLDKLLSFDIFIPPILVQERIANILSGYDYLIEHNTQRIKILEEMAQMLYREWFVKFHFPGHEKVKMVESELGMVPEGWEVKSIGEISTVVLGGTPSRSRSEYWKDGNIPWINSGKLNDIRVIDSSELITEVGLKKSATKIMPRKTVVVAITGAILLSMLEMEACANQSVVGIYDTKFVSQEYLHLYLCENISIFKAKMSGSAQQHINKEIVAGTEILVPSCEISDKFTAVIQPIYSMVAALLIRNVNLRRTRDLLLPKLISGEVDVSRLDINVEEK